MAKVDIKDKYIYKINGSDYFCKFQLITNTGLGQSTEKDFNYLDFNKSAIVSMDLVENFFQPFTTASVTVNNPFDYVDNKVFTRGDGRDQFHITLYDASLDEANIEKERLDYRFVIVGENNSVSKTDRSNNFKTYNLMDVNYFKLNETYTEKFKGFGKVGKIIREILVGQLGQGGSEGDVIDTSRWEDGDHELTGKYIPEAIIPKNGWRYSDLIKYLLRIYYYNEGGIDGLPVQGVLKFDRVTKKYTLQPISKIFADNDNLTFEGFGAGDLTGSTKPERGEFMNPNNPLETRGKVEVNVYTNQLRNTNLTTPMLGYSNEFFTNYSVGYTDDVLGNSFMSQIFIEDVKKYWEKHFVEVFKCMKGKPKPFLPLNMEKERIFKPFISPFQNEEAAKALARAQMVSNLTFFNLQLNIDNLGNTKRTSGTFMDVFNLHDHIDPVTGKERIVDRKLLGRWFITSVRHRFFKDSYQNVLQCIKPYVGPGSVDKKITTPVSPDVGPSK